MSVRVALVRDGHKLEALYSEVYTGKARPPGGEDPRLALTEPVDESGTRLTPTARMANSTLQVASVFCCRS